MSKLLKPGAWLYMRMERLTVASYKGITAPGRKMIESENQFTKAIGAFWLAMFGFLFPLFVLKCVLGYALTGDLFFAWRE